ncbi:MAG: DUF58 domain-containing protein [Lachnospiraceae bacterium]|nr:DUF58 domain-containing protein [Lachnospiraceae bacterium]
MKKRIAAAFFLWMLGVLCFGILTIYSDSRILWMCLFLWILFPFVTWGVNQVAKKNISIAFFAPSSMEKNEKISVTIVVENTGCIPVAGVFCVVEITNLFTGETDKKDILLAAPAKSQMEKALQITSSHCGYLQVKIVKIHVLDWMGFLPIACEKKAKKKISILPDTFSMHLYLSRAMAEMENAEYWSGSEKGLDQTEIFALREYAEGDSLKQMHWKLSSKQQKMIVKEASMPMVKSLLIFWDKNTAHASPEELDAMAESISSIGQELIQQGNSFTLGWTNGNINVFEDIDTEEQILSVIPRMLKTGVNLTAGSGAFLYNQTNGERYFGKVIYMAKTIPADFEEMTKGDMTLLLCDEQIRDLVWKTIRFHAGSYRTDLAAIEL